MKLLTCALVVSVFDITISLDSKSINLNLKTVLEFDQKDKSGDIQLISNVQSFLDNVKTIINKNKNGRRSHNQDHITFTDFLRNAISILRNYDDDDLEDVFDVIDKELRKYHYKGCKFYELIENNDVRRFMANSLNEVSTKTAQEIKKYLNDAHIFLLNDNYTNTVKDFLDYINSLYRYDTRDKFKDFLSNLDNYRSKTKRANLDLIKLVREGVRSILFDYYTGLNENAKRELKLKIEKFLKELFFNLDHIRHKIWNEQYAKTDHSSHLQMIPLNEFHYISVNTIADKITTRRPKHTKIPPISATHSITKRTFKSSTTTRKSKRPKSNYKNFDYIEAVDHITKDAGTVTVPRDKKGKKEKHRHRMTPRDRLRTLWEEELIERKEFKTPIKTIRSNHKAVVNVKKTEIPEYYKSSLRTPASSKHRYRNQHKKNRVGSNHDRKRAAPKFKDQETTKYRKSLTDQVSSNEGMSIESFENILKHSISFRKSNNNNTFSTTNKQIIDFNVINRIDKLEKELKYVKSKMGVKNVRKSNAEKEIINFWDGTTKLIETVETTTILSTALKTSEITSINMKNNQQIYNRDVTVTQLPTATSITQPSHVFSTINSIEFPNISTEGNDRNNNIVRFIDQHNNHTTQLENIITIKDLSTKMENNFTVMPFPDTSRFNPNLDDSKVQTTNAMLQAEKLKEQLPEILINISTSTVSERSTYNLFNMSIRSEEAADPYKDPFKDIDDEMDLL